MLLYELKRRLTNRARATERILTIRALPRRTRWQLLVKLVRQKRSGFDLALPVGKVQFPARTLPEDLGVFFEIFYHLEYACDYRGAVVIDVGAHKGYFGAYACSQGAKRVISYEPQSENFDALRAAAASFTVTGRDWQVHRAAVTSSTGEAELRVSGESWTHSLLPLPDGARREVGQERVSTIAMREILKEIPLDESPRVVKVDAEGAECMIILDTAPEDWRNVDVVFVEIHDQAPCSVGEIVTHLQAADLGLVRRQREVLQFARSRD